MAIISTANNAKLNTSKHETSLPLVVRMASNDNNFDRVSDEYENSNGEESEDDCDNSSLLLDHEFGVAESMDTFLKELEELYDIDDNDDESQVDELGDFETFLSFLEESSSESGGIDAPSSSSFDDIKDPSEVGCMGPASSRTSPKESGAEGINDDAVEAPNTGGTLNILTTRGLENALQDGVVPVDANVGSERLAGDWGFDPMDFANKDYIKQFQCQMLSVLPGSSPIDNYNLTVFDEQRRPSALVLRDYREAEIRHGRLAMLAVVIWPIQEKLDQLLLGDNEFGSILRPNAITLPYFPLLMTLIMMLLGYLDIYAKEIQEDQNIGDAFLPGDCFFDPLKILQGAPSSMQRNMQERELFNGRVAMIAFVAFVFEELVSRRAIIDMPGNEILFTPAYQIPYIQEWLDSIFLNHA